MGQLYEKMASELKLRRYSIRTQKGYLYCAKCFAKHFMRSPAEMGSKEIREFLLKRQNDGASASTIKTYVAGLRFLYAVTLDRLRLSVGFPTTVALPMLSACAAGPVEP